MSSRRFFSLTIPFQRLFNYLPRCSTCWAIHKSHTELLGKLWLDLLEDGSVFASIVDLPESGMLQQGIENWVKEMVIKMRWNKERVKEEVNPSGFLQPSNSIYPQGTWAGSGCYQSAIDHVSVTFPTSAYISQAFPQEVIGCEHTCVCWLLSASGLGGWVVKKHIDRSRLTCQWPVASSYWAGP